MLNRINNLLKQEEMIKRERATATQEVLEAAQLLGINLETSNTIVKNEITINKGRIIEVPTTKEVVIDNTDTATVEMLRETIRRMNQTIDDMNKETAELKEKLAFKELLLNEFRENMDEKIKTIHELENEIEELDRKSHVLMGQNAALQTKLNNANTTPKFIYVEDDHSFDNEEEEKVEEVKNEGGDAVEDFSQYITVTIPDKYKENNEIKDLIKTSEERWNKSHRQQTIKHMNNQILVIIERLEAEANTNMRFITKGKDVIGAQGQITIEGITYQCKYVKTHVLPMLAGCFNMSHIEKAKEMILAMDKSLQPTEEAFKRQDNMHYDFDNKIVVYIEEDGSFKGYNDKEMFVWDSKRYPWPSRRTFAHAIDETPARSFKGVGKAAEQRAFALMQYIRENFMNKTKEAPQVTKESQTTNDDYLETDDEDL